MSESILLPQSVIASCVIAAPLDVFAGEPFGFGPLVTVTPGAEWELRLTANVPVNFPPLSIVALAPFFFSLSVQGSVGVAGIGVHRGVAPGVVRISFVGPDLLTPVPGCQIVFVQATRRGPT